MVVVLVLLGASGCMRPHTEVELLERPRLHVSQDVVEFGEVEPGGEVQVVVYLDNQGGLPLGIRSIAQGEGQQANFGIAWSTDDVTCPAPSAKGSTGTGGTTGTTGTGTTGAGTTGTTGTGTTGTTGTGTTGTTGTGTTGTGAVSPLLVLEPGCILPVTVRFAPVDYGEIRGSLVVETEQDDDVAEGEEPRWFADLLALRSVIILSGSSQPGAGRIVVSPRFHDFGHASPGTVESTVIEVTNAGDGDLLLGEPFVDAACDEAFGVSYVYADGRALAPGTSTLVEVAFEPVDTDPAYCTLTIPSDDRASPEIEVGLQGNTGFNPANVPPEVAIHRPDDGTRHLSADPLRIEATVFDPNQPPETLVCKVRSQVQLGYNVADCQADASGLVVVDLDTSILPAGTDTLAIRVTDESEVTVEATVSVLIRSDYPASDDDGDGYGDAPDEQWVDCDDHDPGAYPMAAERINGKDDDCDTRVDEGTLAGDDDGDTFSEEDGDCDDDDPTTLPGAPELPDLKDNDCDGLVDEGTTLYDDDGDGYAEVNNDCDDADPNIGPGAVEYCDGIDNDCNGLRDEQEGCIAVDTAPIIVGGIQMAQTSCEEGEGIGMSVLVHDPDGDEPTISWSVGSAGGSFNRLDAAEVRWTAPMLPEGSDGGVYTVTAVVLDDDGNQVWANGEVLVYPAGRLYDDYVRVLGEGEPSCGTRVPNGAPAALLAALAALGLRRRRRLGQGGHTA